jgi:hypothetical protein
MGQGNPSRGGAHTGWEIAINGTTDSPVGHVRVDVAGLTGFFSDNALAASAWVMVAAVHSGTTWRLNVNGLDQAATASGSYTASSGPLWVGHDGGLGGNAIIQPQFTGSYAFLIPSALSGAELLAIYQSALLPGGADNGKALLATGLGGSVWDFAIEVTY